VVGSRAITQEQRGDKETVVRYDLLSGTPLWSHAHLAHFQSPLAGEGPRATPTVVGQRVYALGSIGVLSCLDLETGKLFWSKDILRDNQAKNNEWGMSGSPLINHSGRGEQRGGRLRRALTVQYTIVSGCLDDLFGPAGHHECSKSSSGQFR
jgi:hypothetical protein